MTRKQKTESRWHYECAWRLARVLWRERELACYRGSDYHNPQMDMIQEAIDGLTKDRIGSAAWLGMIRREDDNFWIDSRRQTAFFLAKRLPRVPFIQEAIDRHLYPNFTRIRNNWGSDSA